MQTDSEIPDYVVRWYWQLMTDEERRAQRHLMTTMKLSDGRTCRCVVVLDSSSGEKKLLMGKLLSSDVGHMIKSGCNVTPLTLSKYLLSYCFDFLNSFNYY